LNDFIEKIDFRRYLRYGLFVFLTLTAQNMVLGSLRINGVCPTVLPAAAAAIGMFEGATFGPVFSLIMGLFADMAYVETKVMYTLLLPALSLGSAFVSQFFINRRFFAFMGVSILVLLITGALQMLKTLAADAFSMDMLTVVAVQTLWSLPFSALTYFMPARWNKDRIS
jgi:hypothetical protein